MSAVRDWSLITGRGACEVLPLRKGGGGRKTLSHAERGGGHSKFWSSFYVVALSFNHIEGWGEQKYFTL